ncbi:hypothetical protein HID58_077049, partial [Brassica napus]
TDSVDKMDLESTLSLPLISILQRTSLRELQSCFIKVMAEVVVSAMVEGVVSFGVEKLWDLLSRESERLQGVHEHVAGLKRRMRTLQSLLKDADAKKHENEVVRNFLEDVKDIVYDAEDIIESFLLKESSGNEKGIKRRVKRLSCFLVNRRNLSIGIEGITRRMSEVVADMQSFGIKEIMNDGRSLSLKERQRVQREIRQTFPKGSEKGLVGVEESVEELVGHLVENDNIQVVSISGMGGIGKTTLARQVFHHDIVRRHFDGFAWVCVSKEFRRKDIWQKILQDLKLHDENIKQMDENKLQAELFLLLGTSRHLIVIDDVWKNEDWDRIKDVFPQERGKLFNCWKMILTSRDEGVGLHADPTCFAFTPKILTPEESWELCEQIALSRRDKTEKNIRSWGWDYCQMHDMMRGVCLHEAKKENFLQVIKAPTTSTSTVNAHTRRSRRLVVHGGNALNMLGCKSNKKARSVLGFEPDSNMWKQSAQGFQNLQLLRVLDLSEAKFGGRIPSSIGKLIHLRFLSLYMTNRSHLPSSLRNLKLLLYLNIFSVGSVHVPNILKKMVELRYLWLPHSMDDKTKLELSNLVNLEFLWGFNSENCSITDLRGMTRLRTLVVLEGKYTSEILASSLRELRNLERFHLSTNIQSDEAYEVDFIWNFIHLRDLGMSMLMPRLPEHSRFPPNLARISLRECRMEEDPLPILEKLLHLQSVELSYSAFVGRKMVCSKGGFPQLRELILMFLKELEEWEIEEGSMPCLRTLYIQRCNKLKEIPEGLKYIISLKELKISGMKNEWKEKLESGGESYYKVQHIPSRNLLRISTHYSLCDGIYISHQEMEGVNSFDTKHLCSNTRSFTLETRKNLKRLAQVSNTNHLTILTVLTQTIMQNHILDLSITTSLGTIPEELFDIENLDIALNLSWNSLDGFIPARISALNRLSVLDISYNMLSGHLFSLSGLKNLVSLNISHNRFSGYLPDSKVFRQMIEEEMKGNNGLCSKGFRSCFVSNGTRFNTQPEVLMGKQQIDPTIQDGLHIVDWVKKMRDIQVIDKGLLARPECETLGVVLLCVNPVPEDRPTMRDVAAMLSEIRQEREESTKGVENNGCSGSCNNNGGERIYDSSPSSAVQQTAKYLRNS